MSETGEMAALRARVAELEAENTALAQPQTAPAEAPRAPKSRMRTALAIALIAVAAILAPIAVIGTWSRAELVDTDRFVQTFAPLATESSVQDLVVQQVVDAIDANVDIDGLVGDLMQGLGELDLPPNAKLAISVLEAPAAEGVRSLIRTAIEGVVTSDQFAQLWEMALRETHRHTISVLQQDPNSVVQLSDNGTVSIELGVVITEVKAALMNQGFTFADQIPVIDRSIQLLASDALVMTRTVYQVAVTAGFWLPWCVLALVVIGVAVSVNRKRALAWAGVALAASLLLLAAGLGIGRTFFVGTVSPSIMPDTTAQVLFNQLTELMHSVVVALSVLSVIIAMGAWLTGASRFATALRTATGRGFARVRTAADENGLNTGRFGRTVDRLRPAITLVAVIVGVLVVFLQRPVTLGSVFATLMVVLLVLLIVELVRRPGERVTVEGA